MVRLKYALFWANLVSWLRTSPELTSCIRKFLRRLSHTLPPDRKVAMGFLLNGVFCSCIIAAPVWAGL